MNEISDQIAYKIARRLVAFGYPDVTTTMVKEQLKLPRSERNVIGMFAADMLLEYGSVDEDAG